MMFEVMAFKFCPIYIKHQTLNFKLKRRCLHVTAPFHIGPFVVQEVARAPRFVL